MQIRYIRDYSSSSYNEGHLYLERRVELFDWNIKTGSEEILLLLDVRVDLIVICQVEMFSDELDH